MHKALSVDDSADAVLLHKVLTYPKTGPIDAQRKFLRDRLGVTHAHDGGDIMKSKPAVVQQEWRDWISKFQVNSENVDEVPIAVINKQLSLRFPTQEDLTQFVAKEIPEEDVEDHQVSENDFRLHDLSTKDTYVQFKISCVRQRKILARIEELIRVLYTNSI
ncbi:hypothetical protein B484DRAFT_406903 [Ochromonadaceae sp. CCMP2298]|nr:hypothetical protein B484DRAFT_406903 [Ochromonadaceae sp. CCMP2298]